MLHRTLAPAAPRATGSRHIHPGRGPAAMLIAGLVSALAALPVAAAPHAEPSVVERSAPSAAPVPVTRFPGSDRYAAAASVSAFRFAAGVPVAYVATGLNYPDALTASAAAAKHGGPLLLVSTSFIPDATASELARLRPGRIIVMGGPASVADSVVRNLAGYAAGGISRVAGTDRYSAAAALSAQTYPAGVGTAYVTTGENFPDALAGGAMAGRSGSPLLLVKRDSIPSSIAGELARLRPGRIVILGGWGSVSDAVMAALGAYTAGGVTRLTGADRYEGAVAASKATYPNGAPGVFVTTGLNFPDGLTGGVVAALHPGPVLLVPGTSLPASVAAEVKRLSPSQIFILGGPATVSDGVMSSLSALFGDPTNVRPYTSDSAWNTPIASGAAADPNSGRMIATLGAHNGGAVTSDHTQYTFPVYFANASTPRYDVPCRVYKCTVVTTSGTTTVSVLQDVPIPNGARPSAGSDAQIIVIDPATGTEWDLWQVQGGSGGWSASNGSVYNIRWNGMPTRYGSRGAGVPYYAGLIRPWEIAAGRIDHALAFAYPASASRGCVWPASKTDGEDPGTYAIPEGARIQLDPRFTEADFDRWGLDRTGRIIARALQRYGMINIDVSGRPKIYAEDLSVNPYATASWSDSSIRLTSTTIASIPYTAYRVVDLPDGYWTGSTTATKHGQCYR